MFVHPLAPQGTPADRQRRWPVARCQTAPGLFADFAPPEHPVAVTSAAGCVMRDIVHVPAASFPIPQFLRSAGVHHFAATFPESASAAEYGFAARLIRSGVAASSALLADVSPTSSLLHLPVAMSVHNPSMSLKVVAGVVQFAVDTG